MVYSQYVVRHVDSCDGGFGRGHIDRYGPGGQMTYQALEDFVLAVGIAASITMLLIGAGSCAAQQNACGVAQDRLTQLDREEGARLLRTRVCVDYVGHVEQCPAYLEHRARFDTLAAALEVCK